MRWVDGSWTYDEHPNRRLVSAGLPLTSFFVLMENVLELQKNRIWYEHIIFGWFRYTFVSVVFDCCELNVDDVVYLFTAWKISLIAVMVVDISVCLYCFEISVNYLKSTFILGQYDEAKWREIFSTDHFVCSILDVKLSCNPKFWNSGNCICKIFLKFYKMNEMKDY